MGSRILEQMWQSWNESSQKTQRRVKCLSTSCGASVLNSSSAVEAKLELSRFGKVRTSVPWTLEARGPAARSSNEFLESSGVRADQLGVSPWIFRDPICGDGQSFGCSQWRGYRWYRDCPLESKGVLPSRRLFQPKSVEHVINQG